MNSKIILIIKMISKYSLYALVLQCLFVSVVLASGANAQYRSVKEVEISLNSGSISLSNVFQQIESKTDYTFYFHNKDVKSKQLINLSNEGQRTVADVLQQVSQQAGLKFKQINNNISVSKLKRNSSGELVIVALVDVAISGKITDENGQGLPGASVIQKGTSNGVTSDLDGNYKLSVPEDATITISFVGYETQDIIVGAQSTIDIELKPDATQLEEIVVVGYGTQKKSDVTGSVVRVTTEKTRDLLNSNILQSLQGSVAGLNIGTPDQPGEAPSLRIRGQNSISADSNPLIVLDGIIYNGSLNNINANDIATVDILKDASAAAVYGSRSANGVIILTTKKGSSEKPTFNFRVNYGVSNPVKLIEVLDGPGYTQKILDYREATGQEANPSNITDYLTVTETNNYNNGKTIDWYEELVQQSTTQNYDMSVSGRTGKTNYFISGTYYDEKGIVENDNFSRKTVRMNLTNEVTSWYKVHVKSSFSSLDYSGVPVDLTYALSPYSNYYEDGTTDVLEYFPMEDPFFRHPYLNLQIDDSDVRNDLWGMISSELDVPFIEGLKWTMNYAVNKRDRNRNQFQNNTLAITQNGLAFKENYNNFNWLYDNILNYSKEFNNKHSIDATFLYSREYRRATDTRARSTDFFNQKLGYDNLALGAVQTVQSNFSDQNNVGTMGRLNYTYDGTYSLTATVRRDGASVFAAGNKYATFKALGLGWTISNESFMESISWISRLKMRLSYGENGNQAIGRYQTLARLGTRLGVFGDGGSTSTGIFVNSIANPDLGWETTEVYNFGLEFGILDNKLSGSIDYYNSNTNDLLLERGLPRITGQEFVLSNIGAVTNKGIEIAINSVNLKTEEFSWETGFVFDRRRNRIDKLYGQDLDGDGVEDDDVGNGWFIGEPLGVTFGYGIDGIHQADETDLPPGYQPGDFRIVDYDGDGELTPDDRHILGSNNPNYSFSISNTVKYKNFSLYVMVNSIQGGGKNNFYSGNNMHMHNPNERFGSWTERFSFPNIDYWTPNNPSNTASRIDYAAPRNHPYLEDRSFVRIQDVNLGYSFGKDLLSKLNLNNLRVYASIKNLHTFTKWTGYDPQNATTITARPLMRTITFGIDASF